MYVKSCFHPGSYLKDLLDASNKTIEELSSETKLSIDLLSGIILEKYNITEEIAERFAKVFNTSKVYWLNLQKNYDKNHKVRNY